MESEVISASVEALARAVAPHTPREKVRKRWPGIAPAAVSSPEDPGVAEICGDPTITENCLSNSDLCVTT